MGKKKNKKLKKKKISQPQSQPIQTVDATSNESVLETVEREFSVEAAEAPKKVLSAEDEIYLSEEYKHVRTDIRKILIVMAIILIVLFAVYFADLKYGILTHVGDYIYKISHIQSS